MTACHRLYYPTCVLGVAEPLALRLVVNSCGKVQRYYPQYLAFDSVSLGEQEVAFPFPELEPSGAPRLLWRSLFHSSAHSYL